MKTNYHAFLSYSHNSDKYIAVAIQKALQKVAKPLFKLRSSNIFRDQTDLSANPQLLTNIENALNHSQYFILLASRESSDSKWVEKELLYWLNNKAIDIISQLARGNTKISSRPKMSAPISFFYHWKFLKQLSCRAAFDSTHNLAWGRHGRCGYKNMDMILAHHSTYYPNLKHFTSSLTRKPMSPCNI